MIHYQDDTVTLHHGDCLDVLAELQDNSVDSVVTDPPYGIRFMGKSWDGDDITERTNRGRETCPMPTGVGGPKGGYRSAAAEAGRYDLSANAAFGEWCQQWAAECLRVLKPGGHMLAFGGPRTWHRLAAAVEDAGFEIRDSIAWLYGSGFPKSLDVSKAIDKAAGAEREVVGPGINHAAKVKHGGTWTGGVYAQDDYTGADGPMLTAPATDAAKQWNGWGTALKTAFEPIVVARKPLQGTVAANVQAHGTGALNIDSCRVGDGGQLKWSKPRGMGYHGGMAVDGATAEANPSGRWPTNVLLDDAVADQLDWQNGVQKSVVFPTFRYTAKASSSERPKDVDGQGHPTVKPLELMRWLVRLVTPPDGIVLEPFAGSGTTIQAALAEGKRCIAIERDDTYLRLIVARIDKTQLGFDFGGN